MNKRASGAVIALAVLAAACDGGGDDPAGAGAIQGGATTATSAPFETLPLVTETTAPADTDVDDTAAETLDGRCVDIEQRTLETAVEVFYAENQRFPADTLELFTEGFLRVEYTGFEIGADGSVVRAPDHPCTDVTSDVVEPDVVTEVPDEFPVTADDWLEILGADIVAGLGGVECATEIAIILVAAIELGGLDGPDPESMEELEPYLARPIELWTLEPGDDEPQPVPGSGCSTAGFDEEPAGEFPEQEPEETFENRCAVEQRTLETAVEAFVAEEGDERPPTEEELVEIGYLREPFADWDLDGWEVILAPGSACEEVVELDCEIERGSMTIDLERYAQETGSDEPPTEQELAVYSNVREYEHWDLDGGEIVPAPNSICPER